MQKRATTTFLVWDGNELVLSNEVTTRRITNFWCKNRFFESGYIVTGVARRIFDDETLTGLKSLGTVLQRVHNRLVREGYVIESGKIYKPT